ncbi:MAG: type II CAAX endopeptidase family protein [Planctomycetota bacterium]
MQETPDRHSPSRGAELAVLAVAMLLPSLVTLVYFVWAADAATGVQRQAYAVMKTVQFALPVAWVWYAVGSLPRPWPFSTSGTKAGLAFGSAVFLGAVLGFRYVLEPAGVFESAIGPMQEKLLGLGLDSPAKFAAFALFCSTAHAFLEEYYWRWFVFGRMAKHVPLAAAVVVSSLGFMAHHVIVLAHYFGWASPTTWVFSLCVAVGGVFWAWLYHKTGSLWGPWLSHVLVDAGIFAVGYWVCESAF